MLPNSSHGGFGKTVGIIIYLEMRFWFAVEIRSRVEIKASHGKLSLSVSLGQLQNVVAAADDAAAEADDDKEERTGARLLARRVVVFSYFSFFAIFCRKRRKKTQASEL